MVLPFTKLTANTELLPGVAGSVRLKLELAVSRASWAWISPNSAISVRPNGVCVGGYLLEYPLLILTIVDINPLFITPNKLARVLVVAKINLVGARIFVEPSQVESGFLVVDHNIVHTANYLIANIRAAGRYIVRTVVGKSWATVGRHDESNVQR